MSTDSRTETGANDQVIAEGVDEEPIEGNRRLFTGRAYLAIATLATVYAAFHMLALNGVSLSDWTGIELPFLPQFPMETWNFRIVHIAGALALGFLLFSAQTFRAEHEPVETRHAYDSGGAPGASGAVRRRQRPLASSTPSTRVSFDGDGRADRLELKPRHTS
jgi:TRAP-type uncharacterized transport system fused permease subunit